MNLQVVDEDRVAANLDEDLARRAAYHVFESIGAGDASAYASSRDALKHKDALFGVKSGFDRQSMALGLKAGGYWCQNEAHGIPNHQSLTVLFDPDTGKPEAVLSGNYLTAMRTAAACAVSIDLLARKNVETLAIVGAGRQAAYHLRAALCVRQFRNVLVWNRTISRAEMLVNECSGAGPSMRVASLEEAVSSADVVITIVSSFDAILPAGLLSPGAHLAAMGTDTVGKQELAPQILGNSLVFTDDVKQALTLGESQHAFKQKLLKPEDLTPLSDVVVGRMPGRKNDHDITVYDGTGLGLQDVITAKAVLTKIMTKK